MADISATFSALSSTESSNSPSGATNVGSGLDENLRMLGALLAAWRDQSGWGILTLTTVAGTANAITATLASAGSVTFGPTALSAGMKFLLVPASSNTAATAITITSPNGGSSLGSKNIFWNGAACSGGELVANVPAVIEYDGTQFNILGPTIGTRITNSLSGDVSLNNTGTYFVGPTVAQGTVGTWYASGSVVVRDTSNATISAKLWDGTTVIDSGRMFVNGGTAGGTIHLSGYISSPAGNIRISVLDSTNTTGTIGANDSGAGKDSTVSAVRIG